MADAVMVGIDELHLDERNARRSDVKAQADSLREFGQHRPVVVQRSSNKVIAGNHLIMAAKTLGWTEVWVLFVDDDDATALRRALADNLVADRAGWDRDELKELLSELDAPESLPGMSDRRLADLLDEVAAGDEKPVFPIQARPNERYDYVVIFSTNELDGLWLQENLGLARVKSYKSEHVGMSRVITVEQFKSVLNEAVRRGKPFK